MTGVFSGSIDGTFLGKPSPHIEKWIKDYESPVRSYVQDGLVAMWDGIENAGFGVHEPMPLKWMDVSGHGFDMVVSQIVGTGEITFNDNHVLKEGYVTYPGMDTGIILVDGVHTIEACMTFVSFESQNRHSGVGAYPVAIVNNHKSPMYGQFSSPTYHYRRGFFRVDHEKYSGTFSHVQTGYSSDGNLNPTYFDGAPTISNVGGWYGSTTNRLYVTPITSSESLASPPASGVQRIYNVRVYSRALAADEVARNAAVDKKRFNVP